MTRTTLLLIATAVVCFSSIDALGVPSQEQCEIEAAEALRKSTVDTQSLTSLAGQRNELEAYAAAYPENATIRFAAGMALVAGDKVADAIDHFQAAYEQGGWDVRAGFQLALALKMEKRLDESREVSGDLARRNPNNGELRIVWASSYMDVQEYEKAYGIMSPLRPLCFETASRGAAGALRQIGKCEMYLGNHVDAIESLMRSDRLYGGSSLVQAYLGESLLKSGRRAEAKAYLEKALNGNPELPEALYWLGEIVEKDDPSAAKQLFLRAVKAGESGLEINDGDGSSHFILYLAHVKLAQHREASEHRKKAARFGVTRMAPWTVAR